MKALISIPGLRMAVGKYFLLSVMIAIMTVMTVEGVQAGSNPCTSDIQGCVVKSTNKIILNRWETKAFDVFCPSKAPYYRA